MLWTIFVILLVLWLLGVVTSYTLGGFIHVLLIVAVILAVMQLIQGRRALYEPRDAWEAGRPASRGRVACDPAPFAFSGPHARKSYIRACSRSATTIPHLALPPSPSC